MHFQVLISALLKASAPRNPIKSVVEIVIGKHIAKMISGFISTNKNMLYSLTSTSARLGTLNKLDTPHSTYSYISRYTLYSIQYEL